jgi:tRNA-specific 2-thiouridylase
MFPIGELTKGEVRERARALGLATADKPESQEICFVPDGDYAKIVEKIRPEASMLQGDIVDLEGRVLGQHPGIHHFTIGQRHGLGISSNRRLYVTRLDPRERKVFVGDVADLDCRGTRVEAMNWISGKAPESTIRVRVQVRHRHVAVLADVDALDDDRAIVRFDDPVRAVAPGQAAVFYDAEHDEEVLGGGWIAEGIQ